MITPYAAKLLSKLQPNFELVENLPGEFSAPPGTRIPISRKDLANNQLFSRISQGFPGMLSDVRTGSPTDDIAVALRNISEDSAHIAKSYPGKRFPNVVFTPGRKGAYNPATHTVTSSMWPHDLGHQLGQASVHERHPGLVTALRHGGGTLAKNMSWLVPAAMVGGRAVSNMIPGEGDDRILQGITKYGPEAYLGAMAMAHGPSALGFAREIKMAPTDVIRRNLKGKAVTQGAKVAGIYGALALMRHLWRKNDADLEKTSQANMEQSFDFTYKAMPKMIAAGLLGLWLARLGRKTEEDKAPLQRKMIGAASQYRGDNLSGILQGIHFNNSMGAVI